MFAETLHAVTYKRACTEDGIAYLLVRTAYSGLEVLIDGKPVGRTPLEVVAISPGRHKLVVEHPNRHNWNEHDFMREIEIAGSDTLDVRVIFQHSYSINSRPFGATVFVQNEKAGETPTRILLQDQEVAEVGLQKVGYRDTTFTVGETDQRLFNIVLLPKPDLQPALGRDVAKKTSKKLPFLATLGVSLAAGGLALYFRTKADDRFEQYQRTGDPREFDRLFDDAKRFDKFAAASFGVFQVSFALSFFFFLKRAND